MVSLIHTLIRIFEGAFLNFVILNEWLCNKTSVARVLQMNISFNLFETKFVSVQLKGSVNQMRLEI